MSVGTTIVSVIAILCLTLIILYVIALKTKR